jgi:hypothetical protein
LQLYLLNAFSVLSPSVHFGVQWVGWFFKYVRHPLFMFGLRNAALQTGIGRPRELLFLDLYFGLLASSRDPNFTGRHLFWLGLRVVDFIHTFYSRAVIQRQIDVSPAVMEYGLAKKDCGLSTYKP